MITVIPNRFATAVVLIATCSVVNADDVLLIGRPRTSPDRKYSVQLIADPSKHEQEFRISNAKTGRTLALIPMITLLQFLHWSCGSSDAIVAVEHIANGSFLVVMRSNEGEWQDLAYVPPKRPYGDWYASNLIRLKIGSNRIWARYLVKYLPRNAGNRAAHFRIHNMCVDLTTDRVVKDGWRTPGAAELAADDPVYMVRVGTHKNRWISTSDSSEWARGFELANPEIHRDSQ